MINIAVGVVVAARPRRLDTVLAAPRKINFWDDRDIRLLAMMSAEDRAELRLVAETGAVEDRVKAAIALARLRDEAAGDVLAGVLADPACVTETALYIDGVADAFGEHDELLTPWLAVLLDTGDEVSRRCAATSCGQLRVAATGPRLLRLARTGLAELRRTGEHSWDPLSFLTSAAKAWPSREVAEEVQVWLGLRADPDPELAPIDYRPTEAAAQLAARAEPGVYEWALRWCAETLVAGDSSYVVDALLARGQESLPVLDEVVRTSPHEAAAGAALTALAVLDPDRADHYARTDWRRFPAQAVELLGERYRGTAAPDVVALVSQIVEDEDLDLAEYGVKTLVSIGGPAAVAAAARAVERLVALDPYEPELRHLRSLVSTAAPARALAKQLTQLGLASSEVANEVVTELARDPEPASAFTVLLAVLDHAGRLVSVAPEAGRIPPPYDEVLTAFVDAADGALTVENIDLTERPDGGIRFSFTQHGFTRTWDIGVNGDAYDLYTIWEVSDSLRPGNAADPRRFIQLDQGSYAFADPDKLAQFCERNGIKLIGS